MMEENNNIFLAGGNALVYLAKPMHEKYSTTFVWAIHLVGTYLMTNFSTPLPLYTPVHNLTTPLHSPSCVRTWPGRSHGIRGIGGIRGK